MDNRAGSQYEPDYAVPPGEVLDEYLESYGMTQAELAVRTGLAKKTINEIANAKAPITPETALKLERVFGRPAHFWNNLERQYQEDRARLAEKARLQQDLAWLKRVPVASMVKLGWIQKHKDKILQLEHVLGFFGVASPGQWRTVWENHQVAYRQSQRYTTCAEAVSAWLRRGEIEGQQIDCAPYAKAQFRLALKDARSLTRESPEVFQTALVDLCANAGVAVAFVPELPKTGVSGATRWLSQGKALIQLSLRYKSDHHLWFTFFHEAGHILKHGKKAIFLEGNGMDGEQEAEADRFAQEELLPLTELKRFLTTWNRSLAGINVFARSIGIAPGIVVGRLQHDGLMDHAHGNELKRRLIWVRDEHG